MPRKLTVEQFIQKANTIHKDRYDYSLTEYVNYHTKIRIICTKHGIFQQTPMNHLNGFGCPKCSGKHNYSSEEWHTKAKETHGDRYDYSKVEYVNSHTKIRIICFEHGEFKQLPTNHLGGQGCPKCFVGWNFTNNEFIQRAKEIHGDKYDYSLVNYSHSKTKVKIICVIHGIYFQEPANHLHGQGCPKCRSSKGEEKIRCWLESNNITFDEQKRFVDCKDKNPLPFDFYLPDHNCCIEFDGEQHFIPTSFGTDNSIEIKSQNLFLVQKRDNIKTNFCIKNNITLIRVPFYQLNDIKNVLNSQLQFCQ